jgi:type VI secretion system protein ImpH
VADVPGQPRADLTGAPTDPLAVGFFELLRRLETDALRFGRAGVPRNEPARLGQRVRLAVATRDISGFRAGTAERPAGVDVEVLGLLGPEGALPLHITRWVAERLSERWFAGVDDDEKSDTAFLDFCNMLQHRTLALYWRAWGDARPEVQAEHGNGGRVRALTDSLARIAGAAGGSYAPLLRRQGTSVASETYGPERLTRLIADHLQAPVTLVEFVGHWTEIPRPLQTRLGQAHAQLGQGAVAGARVFQRQGRAELRVGPLPLQRFEALADDRGLRDDLQRLVRFTLGREIDIDLRLVLARDAVPAPRVGQVRIGRTTWISPSGQDDAGDLRFRAITADARAANAGAANAGVAAA